MDYIKRHVSSSSGNGQPLNPRETAGAADFRRKIVIIGYGIPGIRGTPEDDNRSRIVYRTLTQIFPNGPMNLAILLVGPDGIVGANVTSVCAGQPSMIAAQLMARESDWANAEVYCLPLNDPTPSILPWLHAFNRSSVLDLHEPILDTILSDGTKTEFPGKQRDLPAIWAAAMNRLDHKKRGTQE